MSETVDRIPVQSSNVAEVGYDPGSMILEVLFHSGSVYQYFDVPEGLFREILQADSVGRFFNQQIRDSYRYVKL